MFRSLTVVMALYFDQINNTINLANYPQRIISLVPSQTEFLFDLGLDAEIVGITQFCVHPATKVANKSIIGGTKRFNFKKIHELNPDLIIGNKEENYREGIERLQKDYPVWISDIKNLDDAYNMMTQLGQMTGKDNSAQNLIASIKARFNKLIKSPSLPTVAYLIWRKPYMVVGNKTFINHILITGGFNNVFSNRDRYPVIQAEELAQAAPDVIFLSSEPYPFQRKHIREFASLSPQSQIRIVDGQLFSWYGSRLLKTPAYLSELKQKL